MVMALVEFTASAKRARQIADVGVVSITVFGSA